MIKQLASKDIKEYLKMGSNKKVLLDVRTVEERDQSGSPDGEKLDLKTYFLTIKDENFVREFKNIAISQDYEILTICGSGQRSQFVAELLEKEDYNCVNISDGFEGNGENIGWKNSGLPCL